MEAPKKEKKNKVLNEVLRKAKEVEGTKKYIIRKQLYVNVCKFRVFVNIFTTLLCLLLLLYISMLNHYLRRCWKDVFGSTTDYEASKFARCVFQ